MTERGFWKVALVCVTVLASAFLLRECWSPVPGLSADEQAALDSLKARVAREAEGRAAADSVAAAALARASADSARADSAIRRANSHARTALAQRVRADSALSALESSKTAADSIPPLVAAVGHLQATVVSQDSVIEAQTAALDARAAENVDLRAVILVVTASRDSARSLLDAVPAQFDVLERRLAEAQRAAKRAKLYGVAGFLVGAGLTRLVGG